MRRLYMLFPLLAVVLLAGCGTSREFAWQRIDSTAEVRADGTLGVSEQLTLRYTGGPFTFAFRDLPQRRLDGITNISVVDGEQTYRQVADEESKEPYTFSVFENDGAQRVRWVYPPTTGGERTFTLRYDVAGAVRRFSDHDEVWWSFVFPGRDSAVEEASARLTLPQPVPAEQIAADAPDWRGPVFRSDGEARVSAANVPKDEELTLRVQFPKNIAGGGTSAWQVAAEAQDAYDLNTRPTVNVVLSVVAAALAVLFGTLIFGWWRRARDPRPEGFAARELPEPPDDLPPALASKLLGRSGGEALLGTLLDLAKRGILTLHERERRDALAVARTDAPAEGLVPFENMTLEALDLTAPGSEATLKERQSSIVKAQGSLDAQYRAGLLERSYFDEAGLRRRRGGLFFGALLLVLGMVGFVPAAILAERYSLWLPIVALVVAISGVAWLVTAAAVRGVTQMGASSLARWQAFRRYLGGVRAQNVPAGQFDTLLPYAVAIGQSKPLTHAYSATAEPLPIWYYPIITGHSASGTNGGSGILHLQDFSQNFISSLTSATSSASSGASGGGGVGGASGGGGGGAG